MTVEEFLIQEVPSIITKVNLGYELTGRENLTINQAKLAMIEFAKYHVEQALLQSFEKARIDRKPTGEGKESDQETSISFYGDLGYEDYIPVEYTINKESILNSYNLENIK